MQTILYGKIIDNNYAMKTGTKKENEKEDEEELNRKRK